MSRPLVEVAEDGTILSVGTWQEVDKLSCTEFYSGVLTAGFINMHSHLELSYLKGAIPERCGFAEFTRIISEVRHLTSPEERVRAAAVEEQKMWLDGVQAVADIANDDSIFPLKERSKIEYHSFAEVYGLKRESFDSLLPLLKFKNTTLTPHSLYSLQEQLFRDIVTNQKSLLSIHFLESDSEKQLYKREGELWERFQRANLNCDFLHYSSPIERLIRSTPRDSRVLLVHNCTLEEQDLEQLLEHFTNPISWCLCPRSNSYISGLKPPVELLRSTNQRVCIGTDSLSSNHSLSIIEELKSISGVELNELLNWATINGALALGVEDRLGSVEVGKRPGLVLLEGVDMQHMRLTSKSRSRRIV